MLRIIAICLLCFGYVAGVNTVSQARVFHGGVAAAVISCPQGNSYPSDGCPAANGTIQHTDLLTNSAYAPGSGQSYTTRPPWNVAGLDYAVGVPSGTVLLDPNGNAPSGCTYQATGNIVGGPLLTCSSAANVTIQHLEFGPIGGHLATTLYLASSLTGTTTIDSNHFLNDSNTDAAAASHQYWIGSAGGSANIVFTNNTVNGACCAGGIVNSVAVLYTTGSLDIERNAFLSIGNQAISAGCTGSCATIGNLTMKYNLFLGFAMRTDCGSCHGEIIEQIFDQTAGHQTTQAQTTYQYNTVVQPNTATGGLTTTLIYVSGGGAPQGPPIYSSVLVDSNTLACNLNSGTKICSSLIDFINGEFPAPTITSNYLDGTGTLLGSLESEGIQAQFTGVIDGSGVLTVSSWSGHTITIGQSLWYAHAASGFTISSQLTGTAGQNGTYQTSSPGAVGSQAMISYGLTGDAVFVNAPTISGNVLLTTAAAHNSWDTLYQVSVPLP